MRNRILSFILVFSLIFILMPQKARAENGYWQLVKTENFGAGTFSFDTVKQTNKVNVGQYSTKYYADDGSITVSANFDMLKDSYIPGEEIKVSVTVTSENGENVPAVAYIDIIDDEPAIINESGYEYPDLADRTKLRVAYTGTAFTNQSNPQKEYYVGFTLNPYEEVTGGYTSDTGTLRSFMIDYNDHDYMGIYYGFKDGSNYTSFKPCGTLFTYKWVPETPKPVHEEGTVVAGGGPGEQSGGDFGGDIVNPGDEGWEPFEGDGPYIDPGTETGDGGGYSSSENNGGSSTYNSGGSYDSTYGGGSGGLGDTIPVVGVGVAIGAGIAVATKRKKKGDNKQKQKDGKQEKKGSTYRIYTDKDFGDTLIPGGEEKTIYARVVEIRQDGREIHRSDLTENLSGFSETQGLFVMTGGISAGRRMINVQIPDVNFSCDSATVGIRFVGKNGTYTEHLQFKVEHEEPRITFKQDILYLPADYFVYNPKHPDINRKLPFLVTGLGENFKVEADITKKGGYRVTLEQDAMHKDMYYAVFDEIPYVAPVEDSAAEQVKAKRAGDFEEYSLNIRASSPDEKREVTVHFPVRRIFMGLRIEADGINCFMDREKKGMPAVSDVFVTLFSWDEYKREMLTIAPYYLSWSFEALPDAPDEEVQVLTNLGLFLQPYDTIGTKENSQMGGGNITAATRCRAFVEKAVLDVPNRFEVILHITAVYQNQQYEARKKVLLRSQPLRVFNNSKEAIDAIKSDSKKRDMLVHVQTRINGRRLLNQLFPLAKLIEVMLDAYDEKYGFDSHQVEIVDNYWRRFVTGGFVGANADPEFTAKRATSFWEFASSAIEDPTRLQESGLVEACIEFIDEMLYQGEQAEASMGFWKRMAFCAATGTIGEGALAILKASRITREYAYSGRDNYGELMKMLIEETVYDELKGRALGVPIGWGVKNLVKGGIKTFYVGKELKVELVTKYKNYTAAKNAQKAIQAAKEAEKAAQNAALKQRIIFNKTHKWTPEEIKLQQQAQTASQNSYKKVMDLQAAHKNLNRYPSEANLKAYNDAAKEVWGDVGARNHLKNLKADGANLLRQDFNDFRNAVYDPVTAGAKKGVAQKLGVPESQIHVFNATGNKRGGYGMDKDVTLIRTDKSGYDMGDVDFKLQEEELLTRFHEKMTGQKNAPMSECRKTAVKYDFTPVAGEFHPEKYADFEGMVKNPGKILKNPERNIQTFIYKSEELLKQSEELRKSADDIMDAVKTRNGVMTEAERNLYNRFLDDSNAANWYSQYTLIKQHKRSTNARNTAFMSRHGNESKISDSLRTKIAIINEGVEFNGTTPFETDLILHDMGTDFRSVVHECANVLNETNY